MPRPLPQPSLPTKPRFGESYYQRYYVDPSTRIGDPAQHEALVCGVVSLIDGFGAELRSVPAIGAGMGRWRKWLSRHRPKVEVVSTELEPETCARYGHLQADIARFRLRRQFDLVVCQGVLPYLDDRHAISAIENIAAMSGQFLYLEAITARDLREVCDVERTDMEVHRRTGKWYLRRLSPHFRRVGAGLFYARRGPLQFFELEAGD